MVKKQQQANNMIKGLTEQEEKRINNHLNQMSSAKRKTVMASEEAFSEWLKTVLREIWEKAKPFLREIWDAIGDWLFGPKDIAPNIIIRTTLYRM